MLNKKAQRLRRSRQTRARIAQPLRFGFVARALGHQDSTFPQANYLECAGGQTALWLFSEWR